MTANNFPSNSRYAGIETTTFERPDGSVIIYLKRRFVPQPERFALLRLHVVGEGERLDNITAAHLGDPEQFWRVCDANRASRTGDPNRALLPEALEAEGTRLRITLPEGVPAATDD
jgi:hypothetical protein